MKLADRERYSVAYFHEPDFPAALRPLAGGEPEEVIHYGSHFTSMFMRCYPERVTTRRILAEDRLEILARMRESVPASRA
ncbi:hypothetical protein [Kutzneria kofuensis]|uniref:hypothetical protein n=1 Tax=Kutzneria kofuensis TaxID=103725 RepID=UPI0031E72A66